MSHPDRTTSGAQSCQRHVLGQEDRRLAKVHLSELRAAGKRVDDVIRQLQVVRQGIERKKNQLQACVDRPSEHVSEYRRVRERCRPPDRAALDALKSNVSKLMSQEPRHTRVSTGLRERMEHFTLQHTASPAEGYHQQPDFLTLARAERGAVQGADNQESDVTENADRGDVRSLAYPLLAKDRPGVNIYAKRVRHLRLFNVVLTTSREFRQGTAQSDDVSRKPECVCRSARTHHHVEIGRCKDSLSIDLQQVHVEPGLGQDLQQAVESTLLAKFNWEVAEQYDERMEQLQTELDQQKQTVQTQLQEASRQQEALTREADSLRAQLTESQAREGAINREQARRLAEMEQQQRAAEERVAALQRQLREQQTMGEKRLRAMESEYQDNIMKFVLKLENRDSLLLDKVSDRLSDYQHVSDVIQRLVRDFNIRLLGVDCGLHFLMETPVSQWVSLTERQREVQRVLEELLPDDVRQDVTWAPVTEYDDVNLQCSEPVTVQEPGSGDTSVDGIRTLASVLDINERGLLFSSMTTTPRRVISISPRQNRDGRDPFITSVVATQDGRLVMADHNNKKMKIIGFTEPKTMLVLRLGGRPWALALLPDGLVAVTVPLSKSLLFVDVKGRLSVTSRVQTPREYRGVSAGTTEDTLIVSSRNDDGGPASIQEITREGRLVRTIIDSNMLRDMSLPDYLCLSQQNYIATVSTGAGPSTDQLAPTLVRGNVRDFGDVQQHLLISDVHANKVFCIDLACARRVNTLEHTDMEGPCQAATDRMGNIYVACNESKCVLVMSGDVGQFRRLLEGRQHGEGQHFWPWGLCMSGSRLVVTWVIPFVDTVLSVYELS